ncbi:hypothetical protein PUN28_014460 [Cardiocondyla obscurior]|uniref:Rac GTPase-activating protein 1 n=1 Tax=Cardiocondyla obscurior TaxID=286306 RepID=A0AAW2F3F7_9HYME
MTSLSLLATYDDLVRCMNVLVNGSCEEEFFKFASSQEEMRQKWLASEQECQRLHSALDKAHNEIADFDRKLRHARRNLEEENRKRRAAEEQRDYLEKQIITARDFLFNDRGKNVNDETKEKLQFLNNTSFRPSNTHQDVPFQKLNTIEELNSTGSLLSDLNCLSRSEDDIETSHILQSHKNRDWKEHRPSTEYSKKNRNTLHKSTELNSSDKIVATTTVVMPKDGAITASSTIEAIPRDENADPQISLHNSRKRRKSSTEYNKSKLSHKDTNEIPIDIAPSAPKAEILTSTSDSEDVFKPSPNIGGYTMNTRLSRRHHFVGKTLIKPEICTPCGKKIRFGKVIQKCRDCRATAHTECKDLVPLPCVPTGNTPTLRGRVIQGTIADYTPIVPPMVPSIVVHCINEVELRGMNEQGLYRESGAVKDVSRLKKKFLEGKGAPNLSDENITTICSTLKDFFRSLREPLITVGKLGDFVRATQLRDEQDVHAALYQAISELPQPNRDTLAFLMLHLQRVSSSAECKMPISNLAKVFGPTVVSYSSQEPSVMLKEIKDQVAIVENLLQIPSDYWATYVNPTHSNGISTPKTGELKHTPSTESLFKRSISRGFFNTPLTSSRSLARKNKKYFATPPSRIGY